MQKRIFAGFLSFVYICIHLSRREVRIPLSDLSPPCLSARSKPRSGGCEITVASKHICCNYDEKEETTVMVNKSTNINKTYNHLSSYLTEHKKEHDI
jgi:hypothetical protein